MTGNVTSLPLTKTSSTTVVVTWRHRFLRVMTSLSMLLSEMNILCIWQKVKMMNNSRDMAYLQSNLNWKTWLYHETDYIINFNFIKVNVTKCSTTSAKNGQLWWLSSNRSISWWSSGATWWPDLNLDQPFWTRNWLKLQHKQFQDDLKKTDSILARSWKWNPRVPSAWSSISNFRKSFNADWFKNFTWTLGHVNNIVITESSLLVMNFCKCMHHLEKLLLF